MTMEKNGCIIHSQEVRDMINIRDCITLKACRIIADIRAEEIASALGVTVDTLYKWEQGRSYPNLPQMRAMIELYASKGYILDVRDIKFF